MRKCGNVVVGYKLTCCESSVRGCVVIMEQPTARAPQFRSFSPNVLPQMAKKTVVELDVHGLALGDKFMVHNPSNVEKHDEHAFDRAAALPHLLRSWGSWTLPLRRLSFSLGTTFLHPPYSPDLAPCDFFLFPKMKLQLKGRRFDGLEDIQRESQNVLDKLQEQDFQHVFQQWQRHWVRRVAAQGDYFEGDAAQT